MASIDKDTLWKSQEWKALEQTLNNLGSNLINTSIHQDWLSTGQVPSNEKLMEMLSIQSLLDQFLKVQDKVKSDAALELAEAVAATNSELAKVKASLEEDYAATKSEFAKVNARLEENHAAIKSELAEVNARLSHVEEDLLEVEERQ